MASISIRIGHVEHVIPSGRIHGQTLHTLAGISTVQQLFLCNPDDTRAAIAADDWLDLTADSSFVVEFMDPSTTIHKSTIDIAVNGHEVEVKDSHLTFEELVALAYPNEVPLPNTIYSITYRKVTSKPHQGELAAGGSIDVKKGSIINVGRTVQS